MPSTGSLGSMPPVGKPLFLTPEELARALRVDPESGAPLAPGGSDTGAEGGAALAGALGGGGKALGGEERLEEALKEVLG